MDLRDIIYNPVLSGDLIGEAGDMAVCSFDTKDFERRSSARIPIEEVNLSWSGEMVLNNREFYASVKGKDREKIIFGVLIEWSDAPVKEDRLAHLHESLFGALVGICVGEIAACVSLAYTASQKAFSEETRHDLAHRLQTLEAHNFTFARKIINFQKSDRTSDDFEDFIKKCYAIKNSNEDLYSTLTFICNMLDNDNLDYSVKPIEFNPHAQIFPRLKDLYNAAIRTKRKDQRLEISAAPIFDSLIFTDERMFNRIMYNLLDNAFKYGYPNTNIIVETEISKDDLWFIVRVSNYCKGIIKADKDRIFEHGERTESDSDGKGLGLFLARKFAEVNGGKLELTRGIIGGNASESGFLFEKNFSCGSGMWRELDKNPHADKSLHNAYKEIKDLYVGQYNRPCSEIGVGVKMFRNTLDAIIPQPPYEIYKTPSEEAEGKKRKSRSIRYTEDQWVKMSNEPIHIVTFTLSLPTSKKSARGLEEKE